MSKGISKVWSADWYWDEEQPLQMQSIELVYTAPWKTGKYNLYYTDIKNMFENDLIEDWVFGHVDPDAKNRDVKELTMFFKHYLMIMQSEGKVDFDVSDDQWSERELVARSGDSNGEEVRPFEGNIDEDQESK